MLIKAVFILASTLGLASAALAAAPIATEQAELARATAARMNEAASSATDPGAPALLPVSSDISLAELERRWAIGLAQAADRQFSSPIAPAVLSAMAQQLDCNDIVGVLPTGFPLTPAQPTVLSGTHLLARCPQRAYLSITAMSMAGKTGKRVNISPQAFNQVVDGKRARRLYYKAPSGRQKETLTIIDGSIVYALEYWSLDDSKQSAMVGTDKMATVTLPR